MPLLKQFSPLLLGAVALGGFLLFINWPQSEDKSSRSSQSQTPVVVTSAKVQSFPVVVEALGTAVANESVNITAKQSQTVTEILFDDGDLVESGQLLARLNNKAEQARLNEININLAEAKRQYNRVKDLAQNRAASEQLLSEQEAKVEALLAQREVAKAELDELEIVAPFKGRLGTRQISLGSLVRPGDLVATLDDLSTIKVDFNVSEQHLASLANGQRIFAKTVAYPDSEFVGLITNIDSRIDPTTRSIKVRAEIANDELKLRPGLLLQINLEKRVLNTLVVPESALVPHGDIQSVFVVDENNKAIKRDVSIGERRPGMVEVLQGLQAGEKVIVEGTLRVRDGSSVKIIG